MNCPNIIQQAVSSLVGCAPYGDGFLVHTTCLYPSNDVVQVIVRGGANEFTVSDDGGAIAAIEAAGVDLIAGGKSLRKYIHTQGLKVERGAIISPKVSAEQLPVAILLVANASQEAAHREMESRKLKPTRDFKHMVETLLLQRFPDRTEKHLAVVGESTKQYKFDYGVRSADGRVLLVDAVTPDYSSIASAVLANLDVRNLNDDHFVQRIVYDDRMPWKAEDIVLLRNGAPTIPYSEFSHNLDPLAA